MPAVLVPLAEGCEEIEAVTVVDLLRRGGVKVVTAALGTRIVHGNHGIGIEADVTLDEALKQSFDMLVLPGGQPGATHLGADPRIQALLKKMEKDGRYIAAICAAPGVLAEAGLLKGKKATSFPDAIKDKSGMDYVEAAVVLDGKIITSRGPGTAIDFGLALVALLMGEEVRKKVEDRLQRPKN
jgi:4-methyl-5(b-hydroxyethyl)-thiazole monophosphate biosynthesis